MVSRDNKTEIIFHNGMKTIGGTLIEIVYGDSRIFFDFGSEFDPNIDETNIGLQGILDNNLQVFVDDLYDKRIKLTNYENLKTNYKNQAVFLSHVHLDHTKLLNFVDPEIPVYTSNKTKTLIESLNLNGEYLYPSEAIDINTREIYGLENRQRIKTGKIELELLEVDHDAYGAAGFIIRTPDKTIAYTGDIRFHGFREEDTLEFCKKSFKADILIMEGVTISFNDVEDDLPEDALTEFGLIDKIKDLVYNNPVRQITFNFYKANIERLLKIIENIPRKTVLSAYSAYVLYKSSGIKSYYYQLDDKDYGLDGEYRIDFEELIQDESKYFWQLSDLALDRLSDMKEGALYIHSNAEPLGEFDPKYLPFVESFSKNNVEFLNVSSSGHAYPRDLIRIIDLIQPKLLVPIHSFRPEKLYNNYGDVLLPEKKQKIY